MTDIEQPKERLWLLPLLSSLLASFTIGFFAPIDTYFTFASEVCFSATEFLPECLLAFAALFGVCFGLAMLLRGKARNIFCALLIGGSLALYLQGNFLNLDYGELNGTDINWDAYGHYGRLNLVYWLLAGLAPLALLLIFKKRFIKIMRFACVFLALMMALSLGMQGLSGAGEPQRNGYAFLTDHQFDLSSKKNIVVFVLDTLDATSAQAYLDARPEVKAKLDGFTCFPNSVSQSVVTKYALPILLGGRTFSYQESYGDYIDETWKNAELFDALKQAGYRNYVYIDSEYASRYALDKVDNAAMVTVELNDHELMVSQLSGLIAFRYAPHLFKKMIQTDAMALSSNKRSTNDDIYIMKNHLLFLNAVKNQSLRAISDAPTFHLYHLFGAHTPYELNSDGTETQDGNLGTVLDAYFNMLDDYFDQMKALGIYNDATIVITADHGNRDVNPHAALMIKRPGDKEAFALSKSLVAEMDIPQTIATAADLGVTLSVGEDAYTSTRTKAEFLSHYYFWGELLRQYSYWVDEQGQLSYDETGTIYTPTGEESRVLADYALGECAEIDTICKMVRYFAEFLDDTDYSNNDIPGGVWFGKPDAQLKLHLTEKGSGPLTLTLDVVDIIGDEQRVLVMNEGKVLAQTVVRKGDDKVVIMLPESLRQNDPFTVTLRFPDASCELDRSGWLSGAIFCQAVKLDAFQLD